MWQHLHAGKQRDSVCHISSAAIMHDGTMDLHPQDMHHQLGTFTSPFIRTTKSSRV